MKAKKQPFNVKKSALSAIIPFLFAGSITAQTFNSVKQVENLNGIQIKHLQPKDTLRLNAQDTLYASGYVPLKEELTLASLPLARIKLTSGYGYRIHPIYGNVRFHNGIDLSARHAVISAVLHGIVLCSAYDPSIGNFVVISHGLFETTYGHLSIRLVKAGELVKAGSSIGISGKSGCVTGEHLHFIVRFKGQSINPLPFLKAILSIHQKEKLTTLLTSKI